MTEQKKSFADSLIACEPTTPHYREKYEQELRAMLEQKLTSDQKKRWIALLALCLLGMVLALWIGLEAIAFHTPDFPLPAYIGTYFLITVAALAVVAGILGKALWQGEYPRPRVTRIIAMTAVAYVGLTGWIFMLGARYTPAALRDDLMIFGLLLVIYGAIAWVRHRIGQAELRTREKLLEIELRLAEIAEALRSKSTSSS